MMAQLRIAFQGRGKVEAFSQAMAFSSRWV